MSWHARAGNLPCPLPSAPKQVLEVQAPGKRVMAARDFVNGLKGRTLLWQPLAQPAAAGA